LIAELEQALAHHPQARRQILGMVQAGRPGQALLLHGPQGCGKARVARELAAVLLAGGETLSVESEGSAGSDAGEHFANVRGRVLRETHPDLTWVRPTGANQMLLEDVEEPVIRAATRTPMESTRRVFVIEQVEKMMSQQANAFLKTLEEPPPYAHFILLTTEPARVLSTVVSRCQEIRFEAIPPAELAISLEQEGIAHQTALSCAALARGDAELARWLASDDGEHTRTDAGRIVAAALRHASGVKRPWREIVQSAQAAGAAAEQQRLAAAEPMLEALPKGRERNAKAKEAEQAAHRAGRQARIAKLDRSLQIAATLLRDLAVTAAGAPERVLTVDRREVIEKNAPGRNPAALMHAAVEVDATRTRLRANVSEELALQSLCLQLDDLVAA
jgi:DNA polymerase-3 subunit delta'